MEQADGGHPAQRRFAVLFLLRRMVALSARTTTLNF